MKLSGEITEADFREADRRRAYLIYAVGAFMAAVATAILYAF